MLRGDSSDPGRRRLFGPASSSIGSHKKHMSPMTWLTCRSRASSPPLTSLLAVFLSPQVGKSEPFAVHQHRADNKSKDRAPVIAAACPWLALVLRQTRPKFRAGPGLQSVCSNADDPRTIAGIRTNSYYMAGAGGQTTMIAPSHDLVVVRLGHYRGETAGAAAFRKALTLLMEAVLRRN
jgi:hypothetical protein